jgi:hypothetical protein
LLPRTISEKAITTLPGLVFDFGERTKHTPFGIYIEIEVSEPRILSAFLRSESCLVNTPRPYFGVEDTRRNIFEKLLRNLLL